MLGVPAIVVGGATLQLVLAGQHASRVRLLEGWTLSRRMARLCVQCAGCHGQLMFLSVGLSRRSGLGWCDPLLFLSLLRERVVLPVLCRPGQEPT